MSAADFGDAVLQIKVGNEFEDALYLNGREITPSTFLISRSVPSYLVVDNFYVEPDKVRDFALKQEFQYHPDYHKGKRTNTVFRFPGLKERFEQLLNRGVRNWEHYGVNGVFQYCESGDEIVWHTDAQQYAGVLFLTPDAPPDTGTTIYRSKTTKATKVLPGRYHDTFPRGHLCGDDFDVVDVVGNVYNRLVLFDGHLIHAASKYFGTNKENGRLFQLFFFDLD